MAIKTLRVFQEFTSSGYIPMPVAGNIDYGVTIANTFPATTPSTFQTDNPDLTVTLTETTDYYVWIRSHGTDWNPMFTRNVRVYPDSALVNNVVMGIIIANLSNTVPYTGANANVNLGNYGITANYLGVNLTPLTTPTTAGDIFWDIQDGTLNVNLLNGYVSHLGGDLPVLVKSDNNSGLTKGSVVYQKGSDGANTTVLLAQANSEATSSKTFGIIANTTSGGAKAYCVTFGYVRGVDTSALTEGATIYLSPTVAGGFTSTKPQAPNHIVTVGRCIKSHATVGVIFVSVQNGFEMDELHDVQITGALNKDVLVYDLSTQLWKNRRIFKTQGYVPFYDDTLLLDNSPIYTNGNYVGIGTETITEKLTVNGNVRAAKFIKVGGASTDFLKGDGSSDPTAYQPLSADLTAIDALALTTGLLRKNGTDTWELDQTEYLSVANAISTYQTLANLSSNLTASTTKYPSVNAVNTGLALKLNLSGGTLTGGLTLNYSYPTIALSDVSSGTTWNILNDGSSFKLNYGATNKFYIFANGNAEFINNLTASALIKAGGTSTQFLKADGSVDSTTYQPYDADLSSIAGLALTTGLLRKNGANNWELDQTEYLPLATAISSYQTISNLSSNLTASSTKYPSVNAVNTGLGLKLNLTGGSLSGDLAISSSIPTLQLSDTSSGTIWNVTNDGGTFKINSGITNKFAMLTSGNASFVGDLTANKFIKVGGTGSQYLMADGTTSSGNAGTVTSVGLSAPIGFSVSGSPVTSSGTLALAFSVGYSLPSDATQATWTAKQNALNGTGFVKIVGTTISYDNSTYYLASNPSGYISGITSGMVTTALGYTPVTNARTLTINGTAYDLSLDRSWTISGTIGGLTSGYIPKATSASTLGNSLIYDNGTNIIIGTTNTYYANQLIVSAGSEGGITIANPLTNGAQYLMFADGTTGADRYRGYVGYDHSNDYMFIGTNASERVRISSIGNVSIGNTNNTYKLDVSGTGRFSGNITGTTATLSGAFSVSGYGGLANSANKFVLDFYNGNSRFYSLGTNTTTKGGYEFHTNSSDGSLDVIALGISSTGAATFSSSVTAAGVTVSSGTLQLVGGTGNNWQIYKDSSNGLQFYLSGGGPAMYINSSQYIGIGTTSPLALLNVVASGTKSTIAIGNTAASTYSQLLMYGGSGKYNWSLGAQYNVNNGFEITPSTAVDGTTFTTPVFQITNTGAATFSSSVTAAQGVNVGANPLGADRMFQVSGTAFTSGAGQFGAVINPTMGTLTTLYGIYVGTNCTSATNSYAIYVESSGGTVTNKYGIYQSGSNDKNYFAGNVGIGTTSPSYQLEIKGTDASTTVTSSDGTAQMRINAQSGLTILETISNTDLRIRTNSTERMRITSGGAIGIGTTNPTYTLDVNGTIRGTDICVQNTSGTGGIFRLDGYQDYLYFYGDSSVLAGYRFGSDAVGVRMQINTTNGNVLIGTTSDPGYKLYVNGTLGVTGAATFSSSVTAASFFESSDKTLKTLLVDNYQAKGIESIVAKLYTKNGKEELGYFAQDVQGILPSAVTKDSYGYLNLSYREVLVAKVQRLEKELEELKAKMN